MGRIRKLAHETGLAQKHAVEQAFDYAVDQRVQTVDGPGVVREVQPGPHPGTETYVVRLDNNLGGGDYNLRQLGPAKETTAAVTSSIPVAASFPVEAITDHLASLDYPELSEILQERLPNERVASLRRQAAKDPDECEWCWNRHYPHQHSPRQCERSTTCDGCGQRSSQDDMTTTPGGDKILCPTCWDSGLHHTAAGPNWYSFQPGQRVLADGNPGYILRLINPGQQALGALQLYEVVLDYGRGSAAFSQAQLQHAPNAYTAVYDPNLPGSHGDQAVDWHQFDTNHAYRSGAQAGMKGDAEERDAAQARVDTQRHDQWDIDYLVGHEHGTERARRNAEGTHAINQLIEQAPEYNSVEHQVDMLGHEIDKQGARDLGGSRYDHGQRVWWHGTPSGDLRGASNGLHIGSQEAARQALHARIGFRADGQDWDGTQEYGQTLLAGKQNLLARERGQYLLTGHNMGLPDQDHYAHEREQMPSFGESEGGDRVQPHHRPDLFPVRITGPMTNTPHNPHPDWHANGYMRAQLGQGRAKSGYYYDNQGEDAGSISAVVPNGDHLERLSRNEHSANRVRPDMPVPIEPPDACSFCGSRQFGDLDDTGRGVRVICAQCGGAMRSWGGQWEPEFPGTPTNHPSPAGDPRAKTNTDIGTIYGPPRAVGVQPNHRNRHSSRPERGPLTWDAIGERHPEIYGDPEVHGDAARHADGEGIGWAANHLAHSRPEDPDAEGSGSWDLDFHEEMVHPRHIDHARHEPGNSRVAWAREGYRAGADVPPVVLVHRHGVYQVADGHHRSEGGHQLDQPIPAYVHYSRHEDEPFGDDGEGERRAPFHGAEPTGLRTEAAERRVDENGWHRDRRPGYEQSETSCRETGGHAFTGEGRCHRCGYSAFDTPDDEDLINSAFDHDHADAGWLLGQNNTGPSRYSALQTTAAMHFEAAWRDVQAKAKRIRKEGGVRIMAADANGVLGEVRGDTALYESQVYYLPGTKKTAYWVCGCKWGAYAWGRSPQFARYEGRPCSHVLALRFEAQARGMFGREVGLDSQRLDDQHPHSPVTVEYQRPTDRHPGGDRNRRTVPPGNMRSEWTPKSRVRVKGSVHETPEQARKKRHQHHHTDDARKHAPNWGYGIGWGAGPLIWCPQCNGGGCGHCAGQGQTIAPGGSIAGGPGPGDMSVTTTPTVASPDGGTGGSDNGMGSAASLRAQADWMTPGEHAEPLGEEVLPELTHDGKVLHESARHTAMPWHNNGGMSAEQADAKSVRQAGFAGYVGHGLAHAMPGQTRIDQVDWHRDDPEYYDELKAKAQADETPDIVDEHLHHFIGEHGTDLDQWREHSPQPVRIDLSRGVYATQSHVGQKHIDRYLANPKDETWDAKKFREDWPGHEMGEDQFQYLSDAAPMFVTHQGRLHAVEGHHRVAAALQRGEGSIEGWHHDLDQHPISRDTWGGGFGDCEDCAYHHDKAQLHAEAMIHTAAESPFAQGNQFAQRLDDTEENEPYIVPRKDEYARDHVAPGGQTYRLLHGVGMMGDTHITAHQRLSNGSYRGVGYLSWFGGKNDPGLRGNVNGGMIYKAHVSAPHRRRGLASAMLNFGLEKRPDLRHSNALSEDGRAFAAATPTPYEQEQGMQHTADWSVGDMLGSPGPQWQLYKAPTGTVDSDNPGSTGFATSEDPPAWEKPLLEQGFGQTSMSSLRNWGDAIVAMHQAAVFSDPEREAQRVQAEQRMQEHYAERKSYRDRGLCDCGGSMKIEEHTPGQHAEFADRAYAAGKTDAWGSPLHQPYDGHGAWSCNNYSCAEHPQEMYEQQPGRAPGWMLHQHDPDKELTREVGKAFYDAGQSEDGRYLLDQQHQGPSKYSSQSGWREAVAAMHHTATEPLVPTHAGVALKAADTGRVLMIQRSNKDESDPAAGTWEFPGGGIEPGDKSSFHGAVREFEEETGHPFPDGGHLSHVWRSGPYVGHVVTVPSEDCLDFSQGRATVNPDDPDGDDHEQSAWWDPEHAQKNPALRSECKGSPWPQIKKAAARYVEPSALPGHCQACGLASSEGPGADGLCARCWHYKNGGGHGANTSGKFPEWQLAEPGIRRSIPLAHGPEFAQGHEEYLHPDDYFEDHEHWHTMSALIAEAVAQGDLHDKPEGALPSTDGAADDEDEEQDPDELEGPEPFVPPTDGVVRPPAASAAPSMPGLQQQAPPQQSMPWSAMGAPPPSSPEMSPGVDSPEQLTAEAGLRKMSAKDFSFQEQQEIINEGAGAGVLARNFASLDIAGTHYALLSDEPEENTWWL